MRSDQQVFPQGHIVRVFSKVNHDYALAQIQGVHSQLQWCQRRFPLHALLLSSYCPHFPLFRNGHLLIYSFICKALVDFLPLVKFKKTLNNN